MLTEIWGGSSLARRGRKRKTGERYANGRIKAEKHQDDRIKTSRQPHRRGVRDHDRLDQRAESSLGRLNLAGAITDAQHHAGQLYAAIVATYRASIESPKQPGAASPTRGSGCTPLACSFYPEECRCLRVRYRYDLAYAALLGARAEAARGYAAVRSQDQQAAKAVARVAIRGEFPTPEEIVHLIRGLDALARHFGLTGRAAVNRPVGIGAQCENRD